MNPLINQWKKRLRRFKNRRRELRNDPEFQKRNSQVMFAVFAGFLVFLAYACWISVKNP